MKLLEPRTLRAVQCFVVFILCIVTGMRFNDIFRMKYQHLVIALFLMNESRTALDAIGTRVCGKGERKTSNSKSRKKRFTVALCIWRNLVNPFYCAKTALHLWVSMMKARGVDTTKGLVFINPNSEIFEKIESAVPSSDCARNDLVVEDIVYRLELDNSTTTGKLPSCPKPFIQSELYLQ